MNAYKGINNLNKKGSCINTPKRRKERKIRKKEKNLGLLFKQHYFYVSR